MAKYVVRVARSAGLIALFLIAAVLGIATGVIFAYAGDLPQISALDDYAPSTITRVYGVARRGGRRVRDPAPRGHPVRSDFAEAEAGDHRRRGLRVRAALRPQHPAHRRRRSSRTSSSGAKAAGASTLTQQLARKLFLTDEKTWERKIKEALLAIQIEKRYTKHEIFTLYCNQMYLGHGVYGVEAASRLYFGKSAKDLTRRGGRAHRRHPPGQRAPEPVREHGRRAAAPQLHARPDGGSRLHHRRPTRRTPGRSRSSCAASRRASPRSRRTSSKKSARSSKRGTAPSSSTKTASRCRPALDVQLQEAANRALDDGLRRIDKRRGFRKPRRNVLAEGHALETFRIRAGIARWPRTTSSRPIVTERRRRGDPAAGRRAPRHRSIAKGSRGPARRPPTQLVTRGRSRRNPAC